MNRSPGQCCAAASEPAARSHHPYKLSGASLRVCLAAARIHGLHVLVSLTCACSSAAGKTAATLPSTMDGGFSNPSGVLQVLDATTFTRPPAQHGPCQSTFEAITQTIFDDAGCTSGACHTTPGPDTPAAGLDLTRADAFHDLVGVRASTALQPPLLRVVPGDESSSFLYSKVAAAEASGPALPAGGGSPMPLGLPPLAAAKLQLLRVWIHAGAPETGVVDGTQAQVDACQNSDQ